MHKVKKKLNILKKIMISLVAIVLVIVLALGLTNIYVIGSTHSRIITEEEAADLNADCVLVLGAAIWGNYPSPMLEDRLITGIDLYKLGASERMLMSGDHGSLYYDEVGVMKAYAIENGVPSSHIFLDHAGFNTYSSMYRARDIFLAEKVVIVTQKYHLYRAIYLAKHMGLDAYGVASDPRTYRGQSMRDIREILARSKDFIKLTVEPKPKYLGDTIPLTGDGDITND